MLALFLIGLAASPVLAAAAGTHGNGIKANATSCKDSSIKMPGLPDRMANLTAYLAGKGYNVDTLNTALAEARAAVAASDKAGFQAAMKSLYTELRNEVKQGTIDKNVLKDYLKDKIKDRRSIQAQKNHRFTQPRNNQTPPVKPANGHTSSNPLMGSMR